MNGTTDFWSDVEFKLFIIFCWMALCGIPFLFVAWLLDAGLGQSTCATFGIVLILPFLFHGTLLTIWHWKSRYRGKHSKLWGALLIIENTGWFRLIYLLRHVVPDRRNKGRYMGAPVSEVAIGGAETGQGQG